MNELIQARVTELQSLPWTAIQDAAVKAGFTDKPDKTLSWKDNALAIAQTEYDLGTLGAPEMPTAETVEPEPVSSPTEPTAPLVKGRYRTGFYKAVGIPFCPLCGEKNLSDSQGNPTCPESFSADICPRLKEH